MPYINLIYDKRADIRRDERQSRVFFLAAGGVGAACALATITLLVRAELLKGEEQRLEAQIQKIKPVNEQIAATQKEFADLNPRVTTLTSAQEITASWDQILTHLTTQTPNKIWLTGMRCTATDAEKPVSIALTGMADAQEPVGEFILRLQNLDKLENVQLRFTQEKIAANFKGTEFEVDTDIAGSAEKKPEIKKEGSS